jgi:ribonuclease HII
MLEAGLDEAGRGCLAGPVFAAAVILPVDYSNELLNDSKQLSRRQRDSLRCQVENEALAWAVAAVDNQEIDEINILNASILAMHRAIDKLKTVPQFLLVDGNRFKPYGDILHKCIVKGDALYLSIAAASVLAKTQRDEYMEKIHHEHPEYSWDNNKGYPTREHKDAINKFGITPYHRKSFNLNEQLSFGFD